jgi:hypothetical protein
VEGEGGEVLEEASCPLNLRLAGQEDQHVPLPLQEGPAGVAGGQGLEGALGWAVQVEDLHRVAFPLQGQDFSLQGPVQVLVGGGGKEGQLEVGADGLLHLEEQGQGQIPLQVALVGLVQQDGGDPLQRGVLQEEAEKKPLGHDQKPGLPALPPLQAHPVAHGLPQRLPQVLRQPGRHRPGRHPPGLKEEDPAGKGLEEPQGKEGALPRPGVGLEEKAAPLKEGHRLFHPVHQTSIWA